MNPQIEPFIAAINASQLAIKFQQATSTIAFDRCTGAVEWSMAVNESARKIKYLSDEALVSLGEIAQALLASSKNPKDIQMPYEWNDVYTIAGAIMTLSSDIKKIGTDFDAQLRQISDDIVALEQLTLTMAKTMEKMQTLHQRLLSSPLYK